ncbi:phenylacetate--CoA ligase [Bacillus carboniphilus]|uniref:Phenylacetate-coenzyme A ligase n=1 Tax=Bacillus carboniphilus TaxID=86663 RepID=A0ABN0WRC0_9BACI
MILHEVEKFERSEIEKLQAEGLQYTVKTVYDKVPFYKNALDNAGINPDDIQTVEDVKKLPFTVKKDLRDHYPFGLFAVDRRSLSRVHASSGTSGKPTVVGYTENDISSWADLIARALTIAGGKPGDMLHNAYGYGLFTGGLGLHHGAERLKVNVVPVSGGNTDRQIQLIEDFEPELLSCTPSYAVNIAERMLELGKDPRKTSIKYGIFGAEPWSEEMRHRLEELLGIKACDIYGLSEIMGPGVAMECHEAQDGLHIADDHFIVEVINPDTLEPVPEGEFGELVFTSLKKEAFPILRYRTGDIASITTEKCKCGRTTTRMSRVKGRIDDMLIIRGVNVFPSEIEHHLISFTELVPHYQVHIHKDGNLDKVSLHVEIEEALFNSWGKQLDCEEAQTLIGKLQHTIKSYCLVSMDIVMKEPKSIPRSEGKAVRVVDHRINNKVFQK